MTTNTSVSLSDPRAFPFAIFNNSKNNSFYAQTSFFCEIFFLEEGFKDLPWRQSDLPWLLTFASGGSGKTDKSFTQVGLLNGVCSTNVRFLYLIFMHLFYHTSNYINREFS